MPLSEKSVTARAAWPPTAASKALPPASRMRREASVASAFMEATAAWRPRITGRMVWPESSACAKLGGTRPTTRRDAITALTARNDRHDIGSATSACLDLWNPTFREERERRCTRQRAQDLTFGGVRARTSQMKPPQAG